MKLSKLQAKNVGQSKSSTRIAFFCSITHPWYVEVIQ